MRGGRVYTPDDLALFARYVEARADYRPKGCTGASMCWVEKGPPAVDTPNGVTLCRGCGLSIMTQVPRSKVARYPQR